MSSIFEEAGTGAGNDPMNPEGTVLLQDTAFERGYGISNRFFESRQGSGPALRDISPWSLRSFPGDVIDPVWCFEEGVYEDFVDESGAHVAELFEHRICVAGEELTNTADLYEVGLFNRRADPPARICSISSDRHGRIQMFFNTKNMIRNVASSHDPCFKQDTWPHFLLCQSLHGVPVANFREIPFCLTARLLGHRKLSDRMAGGPVPEKANFLSYFHLKHQTTSEPLWVGICLFTSCGQERFYEELMSVDQHGTGMYRVPARQHGAPLVPGHASTIGYDLRAALSRALQLSQARATPDDYIIQGFNLGWECIGDHETLIECSGLSVRGLG